MDDASRAPEARRTADAEVAAVFHPRRLIATQTIIALNIAYFLAMVSLGVSASQPMAPDVLPFGANFGARTVNGEWWRLLASTFIHFGIGHLALNMWSLWNVGGFIEHLVGSTRFVVIYVVSGLAGSMASLIWHPEVVSAGASGAIFGVAGALAAIMYLGHTSLPERPARQLLTVLLFFIGLSLAFGFAVPGIDNAGHLGGLVAGTALGAALRYRRTFVAATCASVLLLVGGAFAAKQSAAANPSVLLAEAAIVTQSDPELAIEKAESVVSEHPDLAEGYLLLGQLYLFDDRYQDALEAAQRTRELDPDIEDADRIVGSALHWIGKHEAAVAELQQVIEKDPKQLVAHVLLSRSLKALGRDEEAHEALVEGVKYAPMPSQLFAAIGFNEITETELEFLKGVLREEIEITPDEPEHYNVLSLVLVRLGENDEALESVQRALELNPDAPHIIDSLGTVRLYRGEIDEAVDAYRRAADLSRSYSVYHYNLSLALRRNGDVAAADEALAEAERLEPPIDPPPDGTPIM